VSIGSAVILDEHMTFGTVDILFCKLLLYCEQFLKEILEVITAKGNGILL
jgi:hypothetical protein